ncbi:O-acetylhomoserine aminocarboxypropyltransferase/cysteine synthase family protein [Curtobacterium sp. VKM Ac-1395]|jgi:O-acetylhomoserine (thiol)-lyase|uniref:O-acetylhomoserine aminocarboxypropyltransferase/cysteine synthase family protein n=1 Tax=Curtobacterium sp. VKM Ac-1395 TaxID=2783815 RepID=UPI00188B88A6|nr:PLP-dependent transferase [Curtobacterium sp. VKM Ac-1395]MBF4590959.1 PLP-dependent transferase [Curtobacterium sp. VKM Ac-1395]
MAVEDDWAFETRQIRAGFKSDPGFGGNVPPIAQTAAFVYPSGEDAADRFLLNAPGHTYSRVNNPSAAALERRIADLEGGVAALALASGQAATSLAVLGLARAGDHIVSSASLYGATYTLFASTLKDLGIAFTFVQDPTDLSEWAAAVRPETRAFFGESIPNPRGDVLDFAGVAGVAHDAGVPLIVDNTIATPYLVRPIEHGADIVVHSATKYLAGHGSAIAGLIVDGGTFDWAAYPAKYPQLATTEHSGFSGTNFAEKFGRRAFIQRTRSKLSADLGPAIAPFNAFLVLQGIQTLSLRMDRHVQNAATVAAWLDAHAQVEHVHYAGLPSSPWHHLQQRYVPKGPSAVLAFDLAGGVEAGRRFVAALQLFDHVSNIGDVRSLVVHPASTTHVQMTPSERASAGVGEGLIRLSIGLEHPDDILADLVRGFAAAESSGSRAG